MGLERMKELLDSVYHRYTRRDLADPDPVISLYPYQSPLDQEIAGLVASSLAYGRVQQILRSVERVLGPMGDSPRSFLERSYMEEIRELCMGFKHRFTTQQELVQLLVGAKRVVAEHGSLGETVETFFGEEGDVVRVASRLVAELLPEGERNSLLPNPAMGSACKRLFLFFRWMTRRDKVDPGGWGGVPASALLVPVDVHMHRIGRILGFTRRASSDLKTAREITRGFSSICPEDPVKYDFALTRFGIREDMNVRELTAMLEERACRG
jgi:uncharacterized protein (TIGR02757 family)